jgi:hypothetical protein
MATDTRRFRHLLIAAAASLGMGGCQPPPPSGPTSTAPAADSASQVPVERQANGTPKRYSVVAYGYNYTDTYIDSFEVDGAGGGNLEVSIPTAGGGKHTCCTMLTSGLPLGTEFTIKWTRDRKRWCEQTVRLTKSVPTEPRYLEVHFYQDGHIEIEPTQQASPPRVKLDRFGRGERHKSGNINNDEKLSRCKDGY